jgi:hypothetical protein
MRRPSGEGNENSAPFNQNPGFSSAHTSAELSLVSTPLETSHLSSGLQNTPYQGFTFVQEDISSGCDHLSQDRSYSQHYDNTSLTAMAHHNFLLPDDVKATQGGEGVLYSLYGHDYTSQALYHQALETFPLCSFANSAIAEPTYSALDSSFWGDSTLSPPAPYSS